MTRKEFEKLVEESYGVTGEYLFAKHPTYRIYRHRGNRKWFAAVMELSGDKLGRQDAQVQVVNLKCDPRMIGSFQQENGIYPGYHMNKSHWLTLALDGTAKDDTIRFLLDMSYDLTKGGRR